MEKHIIQVFLVYDFQNYDPGRANSNLTYYLG